ncbi:MAG TPA: ParA family protein [Vicinamibacterales bacterium]
MIIAVLNSKGGVGRTTIAVNLAGALASPQRRVLLVDLDSQASASVWFGVASRDLRPSSASCLIDKYPIGKAIRHTPTQHLDLLTGSIELANVDIALCHQRGREAALKRMLERVAGDYDLILLDCPPGTSLLGINALMAADALLVPVVPEPLAIEALSVQFATIERVRARMGSRSRLLGIVVSLLEARRDHAREVLDRLRSEYRDNVLHTEIRWTTGLARAPAARKTIFALAPRSASADAFRRLAGEVLQRLPSIRH